MELPRDARDELDRAMRDLERRIENASWTPRENLHCTLSFLGAVDDQQVPTIADALSAALGDLVDFPTRLSELGAFPGASRARVVWAGLDDSAGGIAHLAGAVRDGLTALGFEQETRPFRAHVTLARLRVPRRVALDRALAPVRFSVDRVTLFESKLGRPHAVHTAVATFPFRRELAAPRPDEP